MSKISWDDLEQRRFVTGVDRGVFYTREPGYSGVPWYGLTSVKTSEEGLDAKPVYIDGEIQTYDVTPGQFKAVVEAFTYPDEFAWFANGETPVEAGLTATNQDHGLFDLSYRTLEGNSLTGDTTEYQIHLVYNAIAIPSDEEYSTLGTETDPAAFTWDLYTTPLSTTTGVRPTSHFVVHTRHAHPYLISLIESILYGVAGGSDARVPTPEELVDILDTVPNELLRNKFNNPSFEDNTSVTITEINSYVTFSSEWALHGATSLKVEPAETNVLASAGILNLIGTFPADSWISGAVTIHFMQEHPSVLEVDAKRCMNLRTYVSGLQYNSYSTVAPQAPGVYRLILEPVYIPAGATAVEIRLYNGKQLSAPLVDVYFEDLVLLGAATEAEINLQHSRLLALPDKYFDGNTDNKKWGYGEWVGTADQSQSVYRSFGVSGVDL